MAIHIEHTATLTSDSGIPLVLAAEQFAKQHYDKKFGFSVVDASGRLVAMLRMHEASTTTIQVSRDKAFTAVSFGIDTGEWNTRLRENFGGTAFVSSAIDHAIPIAGGIPIVVDGLIVGAIGVSGGTSQEDTDIALAAIKEVMNS